MDKPPPDDFDPYLGEPVQEPSERRNERKQGNSPQNDVLEDIEIPMLHVLPAPLKKLLFTGSCCAGVGVLYVLSAWDYGWIPGLNSSFAAATEVQNIKSDLQEVYVLQLARAIRDLSTDNCTAHSRAITEQIDLLQSKYKARNGEKYPHTDCKKLEVT